MIKSLRARLQQEDSSLVGNIAALVYSKKLETNLQDSLFLAHRIFDGLREGKLIIGALKNSGIEVLFPSIDTTDHTVEWFNALILLADDFFTGSYVKSVNNLVNSKLTRESIVTFRRMRG